MAVCVDGLTLASVAVEAMTCLVASTQKGTRERERTATEQCAGLFMPSPSRHTVDTRARTSQSQVVASRHHQTRHARSLYRSKRLASPPTTTPIDCARRHRRSRTRTQPGHLPELSETRRAPAPALCGPLPTKVQSAWSLQPSVTDTDTVTVVRLSQATDTYERERETFSEKESIKTK